MGGLDWIGFHKDALPLMGSIRHTPVNKEVTEDNENMERMERVH
jgi:hypothetical protein